MTTRSRRISDSTIRRLSLYLRTLEAFEREGESTVSSRVLARRAGTTAAQVRKDLSAFGSFGKRGLGYAVPPLRSHLARIMGLDRSWPVVLVGAGRIGAALFEYPHFRTRGFRIVSVLDRDPAKIGRHWNGVEVEPVEALRDVVRTREIAVAIVAVPAEVAQGVVDELVAAGVRGILNFAPIQLRVPPDVSVNHVNLVMELEALSFALGEGGGERARDGAANREPDEKGTEDGGGEQGAAQREGGT